MNYVKGICTKCEDENFIIKKLPSGKLCQKCNRERLDTLKVKDEVTEEGKRPRIFRKQPVKYKRKATGEGEVFDEIKAERPLVSFVSDVPLNPWEVDTCKVFAHVLPKSKYPLFRLVKKYIVLLTWAEHMAYDQGTEEQRVGPGWDKLRELREEALKEYAALLDSLDISYKKEGVLND